MLPSTASFRLAFLALVLAASACSGNDDVNNCTSDVECPAGQECVRGLCVAQDLSCSAIQPCPSGFSCCGGTCNPSSCCAFDRDCEDGWCNAGVCVDGPRPNCDVDTPCTDGTCLSIIGRCVECLDSNECSDGRICNLSNECQLPGGCALEDNCSAQGQVCDVETGNCRPCAAQVECGERACIGGVCQSCQTDTQCGPARNCVAGACVNAFGASCSSTSDCTEGLICAPDGRCDACRLPGECPGGAPCVDGRCQTSVGIGCSSDSQCNPPATVCQGSSCVAGCANGSCGVGSSCDLNTGRCVPTTAGSLPLGEDCAAHNDCNTDYCRSIILGGGQVETVCTQSCVRVEDCPVGTVCVTLGDGDVCLPTSLIGTAPYDLPPGATCTDDFISTQCASGFCDSRTNRCIQTCARDDDCTAVDPSYVCVYRNLIGIDANDDGFVNPQDGAEFQGWAALCQPPLLFGRSPGAQCVDDGEITIDHDRCLNGFCVQTPDFFTTPSCAVGCCTPEDCSFGRPICKPIDMWDGIRITREDAPSEPYGFQKSCLWREYAGTKGAGETCSSNEECESEMCIKGASGVGRCTQTCCRPSDCAGFAWSVGCRTPVTNLSTAEDDGVFDPFFDENWLAMGREIVAVDFSDERAVGVTSICMPQ